jgi:teichuronic acid biosynthesis glycosyltransferase TuaC
LRALVVSNMLPDAAHPERGRFVRDQVAALRQLDGLEVAIHEFPPGAGALAGAALQLRRRYDGRFDVVHAHFGLTAWPALAIPARVRALTVHGTDVRHPHASRPSPGDLLADRSGPSFTRRQCVLAFAMRIRATLAAPATG